MSRFTLSKLTLFCIFLTACSGLPQPLPNSRSRPTALRFGMAVTPEQEHNPIHPPERFMGYHAGLDYEIFDSEKDTNVPVFAICNGTVLYSAFAKGYGGLLVQRCNIQNQDVTVLYGHLDGTSLVPEGHTLSAGETLGSLAAAKSMWSDGNRKHLHLGIHRGQEPDVRGYVDTGEELSQFIDPRSVLGAGASGRPVEDFYVEE